MCDSDLAGVIITDSRGRITDANDVFLKMLGYGRRDLPLIPERITPPEWCAVDIAKRQDLASRGPCVIWEKEYLAEDGRRVPALVSAALPWGVEEDCLGIVVDLTDKRQTEIALRVSEERYRALYEHIPLMYFTMDADGIILSVNAHGARQLGYTQEELVGQSLLRVFHEEDREAVREQFTACVENPGRVRSWDFRKIRKDGSVLWVRESARAVEGGGRTVVLVVCEDVTEHRRAEQRVIEHEHQLQMLASKLVLAEERERRRIAIGLHDQIGQSLAVALGELAALPQAELPEPVVGTLREVRDRLERVIEASRSLTFELSSPVLYELGLEAALRDLGDRSAERSGFRFHFQTDGRPKPLTDDSKIVLFRAVRELLFNVRTHARARTVKMTVDRVDERIRITLEDDGLGFDARGAGSRVRPEGGFGLFNIREQLEEIGGRFEIEAAAGKGTRVLLEAFLERAESPRS